MPDWIGTDGERLGWLVRDRLFLQSGDGVELIELPDEAEWAVATPERWTIALGSGFVRVSPRTGRIEELLVDDEAEPIATWPGLDVGLFVEVPEHRLLRLSDGRPLPLPSGALRARHVRPWTVGVGAIWLDGETLYRSGGRVAAIGRAPGAEGLAAGPHGAVLAGLAGRSVVAAPEKLAVEVDEHLDVDTARFSADGRSVLAVGEDGMVLVDTTTGEVRQRWDGERSPVGFAPGPVWWEDGVVRSEERVFLAGFSGAAPALSGTLLLGPGGDGWRLDDGRRLGLRLSGVCATDGDVVVSADDEGVMVLAGGETRRFTHGLCDGDDLIESASLHEGVLTLRTLDGESGRFRLDGTRLERERRARRRVITRPCPEGWKLPAEDGESVLWVGETRLPLPVDGAAERGRRWAWSRDGALYEV